MLSTTQVVVDGQRISYATEGSGPPLLLLHGLGFDHQAWALVSGYLAGHFQLLIPDLPGFGGSRQANWDGAPETLVRLIAGFLTVTQAVPAFVAGAGFGGTVALLLAVRYPERVRAVVAVGAAGSEIWPATSQAGLARFAGRLGLLGLALQIAPQHHAQRLLADMLATTTPPPEMVHAVSEIMRDPRSRQMLMRVIGRLPAWSNSLRQVGGIRVPVQLIWGERDMLYGLPQAERLRHSIPSARLLSLPGAGHALTLERPAELAAAIRQVFGQRRTS